MVYNSGLFSRKGVDSSSIQEYSIYCTQRARRGDTWTGVDVIVPIGQRRHRAVHASCPTRKKVQWYNGASAMAQAGTRRGKLYSAPQPCTNWPTTLRARRGDTWTGLDVIVPIGQRRHRAVHASCPTRKKVQWCNGASAMAQAGTRRGKLYSAPQPCTNWPTTQRARRGDTWTGVDVIVPIGQRRHRAVHASCPTRKKVQWYNGASAMAQAGTRRGKLYSAPQPCTNWPTTLRARRGDTGTGVDVIVPIGQRRHRAVHASCPTRKKVQWCNGASAMAQAGTRRGKLYSAPQPCTNWPTTLRARRGDTWTGVDVIVPIGQRRHRAVLASCLTRKRFNDTMGRAQWRKLAPGEASCIAHLSPAPTGPPRCVPVEVTREPELMSSCP